MKETPAVEGDLLLHSASGPSLGRDRSANVKQAKPYVRQMNHSRSVASSLLSAGLMGQDVRTVGSFLDAVEEESKKRDNKAAVPTAPKSNKKARKGVSPGISSSPDDGDEPSKHQANQRVHLPSLVPRVPGHGAEPRLALDAIVPTSSPPQTAPRALVPTALQEPISVEPKEAMVLMALVKDPGPVVPRNHQPPPATSIPRNHQPPPPTSIPRRFHQKEQAPLLTTEQMRRTDRMELEFDGHAFRATEFPTNNPIDRKETKALMDAYHKMQSEFARKKVTLDAQAAFQWEQSMYLSVMNEITRQVGLHCNERGKLLQDITTQLVKMQRSPAQEEKKPEKVEQPEKEAALHDSRELIVATSKICELEKDLIERDLKLGIAERQLALLRTQMTDLQREATRWQDFYEVTSEENKTLNAQNADLRATESETANRFNLYNQTILALRDDLEGALKTITQYEGLENVIFKAKQLVLQAPNTVQMELQKPDVAEAQIQTDISHSPNYDGPHLHREPTRRLNVVQEHARVIQAAIESVPEDPIDSTWADPDDEARSMINNLRFKYIGFRALSASLRYRLRESNMVISRLERSIAVIEESHREAMQRADAAVEEAKTVSASIENRLKRRVIDLEEGKKVLADEIKDHKKVIEGFQKEIHGKEDKLAAEKKEKARLRDEISLVQSELEKLHERLTHAENQSRDLMSRIMDKEAALSFKQEEIDLLQANVKTNAKRAQDAEYLYRDAIAANSRLLQQLTSLKTDQANLTHDEKLSLALVQINTANTKIAQLEAEKQELLTGLADTQSQLDKQSQANAQLVHKLESSYADLHNAREESNVIQATLVETQMKLEDTEARLIMAMKRQDSAEQELQEMLGRIRELESRPEKVSHGPSDAEELSAEDVAELGRLSAENLQLKEDLREITRRADWLQKEIARLNGTRTMHSSLSASAKDEYESRIRDLETQLADAIARAEAAAMQSHATLRTPGTHRRSSMVTTRRHSVKPSVTFKFPKDQDFFKELCDMSDTGKKCVQVVLDDPDDEYEHQALSGISRVLQSFEDGARAVDFHVTVAKAALQLELSMMNDSYVAENDEEAPQPQEATASEEEKQELPPAVVQADVTMLQADVITEVVTEQIQSMQEQVRLRVLRMYEDVQKQVTDLASNVVHQKQSHDILLEEIQQSKIAARQQEIALVSCMAKLKDAEEQIKVLETDLAERGAQLQEVTESRDAERWERIDWEKKLRESLRELIMEQLRSKGRTHRSVQTEDFTLAAVGSFLVPSTRTSQALSTRPRLGAPAIRDKPRFLEFIPSGDNNAQRHKPTRPLMWIIRTIRQIYDDKILADAADFRHRSWRDAMPEYVYDWMTQRYGLKQLVDQMCWDLYRGVSYYHKASPEIRVFGKFLDDDYGLEETSFYLYIRSMLREADHGDALEAIAVHYMTLARAEELVHRVLEPIPQADRERVVNSLVEKSVPLKDLSPGSIIQGPSRPQTTQSPDPLPTLSRGVAPTWSAGSLAGVTGGYVTPFYSSLGGTGGVPPSFRKGVLTPAVPRSGVNTAGSNVGNTTLELRRKAPRPVTVDGAWDKCVEVHAYLEAVLDEFYSQHRAFMERARAIWKEAAGDDKAIGPEKFTVVMKKLVPCWTSDQISAVFAEATVVMPSTLRRVNEQLLLDLCVQHECFTRNFSLPPFLTDDSKLSDQQMGALYDLLSSHWTSLEPTVKKVMIRMDRARRTASPSGAT